MEFLLNTLQIFRNIGENSAMSMSSQLEFTVYKDGILGIHTLGNVNDLTQFQEQVTSLLSSYGELLESAYLHNIKENEILKVANACKNCRFHLGDTGGPLMDYKL